MELPKLSPGKRHVLPRPPASADACLLAQWAVREAAAGRVLNAAFLTYVAGAISSLTTLLYFLLRAGLIGRRDD